MDDLIKREIICPSKSPYVNPIVLVHKKTKKYDFFDFQELNKITIKDHFPIQLIDDNLNRLCKNLYKNFFSIFNLRDGFYHVKMANSSISFVTLLGQYKFLRMPFGLINAPRVFQRFVNEAFSDLMQENKVLLYLDNVLVATKIIEHFKF